MQYKDYYRILGVDKKSTQDDIKKAFRKLAKIYHPDANPGNKQAEDKFKDLNEAYEVLSDPEKRKKYDDFKEENSFRNGFDFNPDQRSHRKDEWYEYGTDGGGNHSDFFDVFFGNSSFDLNNFFNRSRSKRRRTDYPLRGEDIEALIEITPEEGFSGAEKRIILTGPEGEKSITFKIPKGIGAGEKIRLKGQGEPGIKGGECGDLYLVVTFKKGDRFCIEGNDLHMTIDIMPWDAALGSEISIETIDSKIMVKLPACTQSDDKIRISNKGYIDRDGRRGDLYIKVRIVNPKVITPQIQRLYGRLKQLSKARKNGG